MDATWASILASWPMDASVVVPVALVAWIYIRGYLRLRARGAGVVSRRRLALFSMGLGVLFVALASPIDPLSDLLLSVHMIQHLLLMVLAPILVAGGAPGLPLVHGLPRLLRPAATEVMTSPLAEWVRSAATLPMRLLVFTVVSWVWHLPGVYELTLRSQPWHYTEHAAFFGAALLFWWPVIAPWPSSRRAPDRWWLIPYLLVAGVQGTALASFITFASRVLYPHYARVPRVLGTNALDDQAMAGALLWVFGCVAYLLAAVRLIPELLASRRVRPRRLPVIVEPRATRERGSRGNVGRLLSARRPRILAQLALFALAALVVADGLLGPQLPPMNAAGVGPWIYFRGLLVIGILFAGNLFCGVCPFTLSRKLTRLLPFRRRRWPRVLRNKWVAIALLVLFLWAYEALSLWSSPFWTAWLIVAYFVGAAVVDALFDGAAFCKHVCPIGQFDFVHALVSPSEVRARSEDVCASCTTHECVRGSASSPGCQTDLFVPLKSGNMDCTFCLDCARACPHDNVTLASVTPGLDLVRDPPRRSGVGRFADRLDLTALVSVLVFGGFVNAAAMVGPALALEDRLVEASGWPRPLVVGAELAVGLLVAPLLFVSASAWLSKRFGGARGSVRVVAGRFVRALVPLGLGMWAAHTAFHFLTGLGAVFPVAGRFLGRMPIMAMNASAAPWILHTELLLLAARAPRRALRGLPKRTRARRRRQGAPGGASLGRADDRALRGRGLDAAVSDGDAGDVVRRRVASMLGVAVLMLVAAHRAEADGGTVRVSDVRGHYRVTVFTTPTPPRAAALDVSVLVQDASSGEVDRDATVVVRARPPRGDAPIEARASRDLATNKLYSAAIVDLPRSGRWRIDVDVDGPAGEAHTGFDLTVAETSPRWAQEWPWIFWPALPISWFVSKRGWSFLRLARERAHHRSATQRLSSWSRSSR